MAESALITQLTPYTVFGPAAGPLWPVLPNLGLAASFTYSKDYYIYGYQAFFAGLSTFSGPTLAPVSYVPQPIIASVILGIDTPIFNLQTPVGGNSLNNVLLSLQGGLSYIPANANVNPPRPETFAQGDSVSLMFEAGKKIRIPAGSPVSLYIRLSNNTVYDSAGFQLTMYTMPS